LTRRDRGGTLVDGRFAATDPDRSERFPVAKALMGHISTDGRTTTVLSVENRRLRRRVEDLEALVLSLQADNDRLEAAVRDDARPVEDLQPV
jgi:hypothetical protein